MKKYFSLIFLNYLRILAKAQIVKIRYLQKTKGKSLTIVGITGSAGKSSALNACEAALSSHFVIKTNGGSNSESGIPFSILGIKATSYSPTDWLKYALLAPIKLITNWQSYDIYLCEMGIDGPDEPKNMGYLLKIIRPRIGIFLNVSSVHSQMFDKTLPEDIKKDQRTSQILLKIGLEKARLITSLPSSGFALLNLDDPVVSKTSLNTLAKKVSLKPLAIDLPGYAPPAGFNISLSAAVALAEIFGIGRSTAIADIKKNLILPPGRSSLIPALKKSLIIDSSYNSSPLSCSGMLDVLKKYPSPRIAVLGDMRELGRQSETAHERIYRQAVKSADTIITVGPLTKKYFGNQTIKFDYWWQANEYIKEHLQSKSTILIKGSQNNIFLEEIVKSLMTSSHPLCRQSPHWLNVKTSFRRRFE